MFDKIGYKIKVIAESQYVLFVLGCIIAGIYLISIEFVFLGIFVFILGFVMAPISAFLLYGFGELIDKVNEISENIKSDGLNINNVENNVDEQVQEVSKVNYSGYVFLAVVTVIIPIVVAIIAFCGLSSSDEGTINAYEAVVSIEYNDG